MLRYLSAIAALFVLAAAPVWAGDAFVFAAFNQATLARHAPLPAPQGDGSAADGGRVTLDWTSESHFEQAGEEFLLLDGEILRLGLALRRTWAGLQWSAELPLLVTGGGVLDSMIENWHDWFGLPNGGRDQIARDQYRYQYRIGEATVLDLDGSDTALGDLRLGVARCVDDGGCWHALAQLPTGDAERLLGGGTGVSAWYERAYRLGTRWSGALAAGAGAVRGDGPLEDRQKPLLPFGWASLGYAFTPAWQAGAQLYAHGPLYEDSQPDAFTRSGLQVVFGLRYRSGNGVCWQLAVQEDPITKSSPDFVIHMAADW
ncbi:DUF3187 family protein [Sinimarinibacterium thermocellulolyticum]|uniref:DUF3187 family protein n=1 Tax=Sinimarinibacterium thermocellulolyticum TaxID=3170016 RepID=A0ABV2ADB9_9GAMM